MNDRENLAPANATERLAPIGKARFLSHGSDLTLVGTIGTTLALLKTPTNTVEVRGVGESLNGVTVLAVRPSEVDVRFNGQILKLAKPAEQR